MAIHSLADCSELINQQITAQETLLEQLSKVEALANVALGEDFLDYNSSTIHAYLWVLSDMIGETKTHAEGTLDYLLKCNRYPSINRKA